MSKLSEELKGLQPEDALMILHRVSHDDLKNEYINLAASLNSVPSSRPPSTAKIPENPQLKKCTTALCMGIAVGKAKLCDDCKRDKKAKKK